MKFIHFYRTVFLLALACIFPAMLIAGDKETDDKILRHLIIEEISQSFDDTIPGRRAGEKKGQDRSEDNRTGGHRDADRRPDLNRPEQGIRGGNQNLRPKQGIKEVPRSIPKLKPKAVTDRIPIRKPPMKIPKKGYGGIRF